MLFDRFVFRVVQRTAWRRRPPAARAAMIHRPLCHARVRLAAGAFALLVGAGLGAQGTEPPLGATLEGMLLEARAQHPELRAMQLEAQAAAQRVKPAGSLRDPMLGIEWRDVTNEMSGGNPNLLPARVGSTRYQFKQSFAPWGARAARRDVAVAGAEEAEARAGATWTELALRVKTAWARWEQTHAQLAQTRELLALIERLEAVAQARYAAGVAAQQDALRAQVERTTLLTELALLAADRAVTQARLNGLMQRPTEAALAPPRLRDAPVLAAVPLPADLRNRVLATSPQLAAEDARIRGAERTQDAVLANRWPEVTLGIAPIQTRNRIAEWELMLEVSLPLQQGSRRAEEAEAQLMVQAARARRAALASETLTQLDEMLATLGALLEIDRTTARTLLPQAELTLQAALAGYETAKVDFATVLEAQRQIRQAQLTVIRNRAEIRLRVAEIERLIGADL